MIINIQVKRLLRADNEAISVNWEVITESELSANKVIMYILASNLVRRSQ